MLKRVISMHEHLGYGRLSFENGTYAEYDAGKEKLNADLKQLMDFINTDSMGCVIYPQMPYKQYSSANSYMKSSTEQINEKFFSMIDYESKVIWYPFVYIRVTEDWKESELILKRYEDVSYGIKLHPDAEMASAEDFEKSKIFELAKFYNKPITIHCGRPGRGMDLGLIYDRFIELIAQSNVNVNVAHVGFLHKYMYEKSFPDNVWFDMSPIGIVEDNLSHMDEPTDTFDNIITKIVNRHGHKLMYGEDFPFNIQKWEDGSIHGRNRKEDFIMLTDLLQRNGISREAVFYNNACRFLGLSDK